MIQHNYTLAVRLEVVEYIFSHMPPPFPGEGTRRR